MPDNAVQILPPALSTGNLSIQDVLMSQIDTSDPTMSLIMQMLANQSHASESHDDPEDDEEREETKLRLKKMSLGIRKLRKKHEDLQTELSELQLRNDTLAAALGACYLCWGEYNACEVCEGEGAVGHFPIELRAFSELILPAVRAFKQQKNTADDNSKQPIE